MTPIDLTAALLDWANKNICNNIDFMPDDKMSWKPEPTSKSPYEIIGHMVNTVETMTTGIKGTDKRDLPTPTSKDQAKSLVNEVIQNHVSCIKSLSDEQLKGKVTLGPLGEFPMTMAAGLPVVECINHHGQLTYIETLLGDEESHLILH